MYYYFRKGNKLACHGSHTFISRWQDFPITPRSPKKVGRRQRHRPRPKIAGRNEEKRKGKIGEIVGWRRRRCRKRERGRKNFVHSSQFVSVRSVPGNGKNLRGEERIGRQREEISFKKWKEGLSARKSKRITREVSLFKKKLGNGANEHIWEKWDMLFFFFFARHTLLGKTRSNGIKIGRRRLP